MQGERQPSSQRAMTDQRGLFRISVHRKGFLLRRGDTTVCEIYDLTEKGLQIVTEIPLVVGEAVALEFQLIDRRSFTAPCW